MHETKENGGEETLSLEALTTFGAFLLRAAGRHWLLCGTCFLSTVALAGLALSVMPKTYQIDSRVLTAASYVLPNLAGPGSALPVQAQYQGRRGAQEFIKARDNIQGIIEETDLVARWRPTRTMVRRAIDFVTEAIRGPLSSADVNEALIGLLDDRLWVHVEGDVVAITTTWHDPVVGLDIVKTAQKRFLDSRQKAEVGEFEETISILKRSVDASQQRLEAATRRLEGAARSRMPNRAARQLARSLPRPDTNQETSGEQVRLEQTLSVKRQEIRNMEITFQERVARLESQLNGLRASLAPGHPDVLRASRELEIHSRPPEELDRLRREEAKLAQELRATTRAVTGARAVPRVLEMLPASGTTVDPEMERLLEQYRQAESVHFNLSDRLETAQMALHTAKASFSYRYIVTLPPVLPRKPVKPRPTKILLASLVAGVFLALFFGALADLGPGRIVERWQMERLLGVPVLGELEE